MGTFSGNQGGASFTPAAHATNANNITLDADTAGDYGKVIGFGWGGRGTTSLGYRTRWGRATTLGTTPSAITPGKSNPQQAQLCSVNTYSSAPALAADPAALHAQDWNLVGGGGYIVLPLSGGWSVVNGAQPYQQIACGNIAGSDAGLSSYNITWEE